MEDKAKFAEAVGQALCEYSREPVVRAEYMQFLQDYEGGTYTREIVRITFRNGYQKDVSVNGSSCIAIMFDLYRGLI